jgi:hypothetical protein
MESEAFTILSCNKGVPVDAVLMLSFSGFLGFDVLADLNFMPFTRIIQAVPFFHFGKGLDFDRAL